MTRGKDGRTGKWRAVGMSLLIAALLVLSFPRGVAADSLPPHRFLGTATLNGVLVDQWTEVSAWVGGYRWAYTYTGAIYGQQPYQFMIDVPADDPATPEKEGAVEGDTVVFQVAGITAIETKVFHPGGYEINVNLHAETPPNSLVFLIPPQTITAAQPSGVMTVQRLDENGQPKNVESDTTLNLLSTSVQGRFSKSDTLWSDVTSVTMLAGQNTASFYYKDTIAGNSTITVAEYPSQGWADGIQQETITPLSATHLTVSGITDPVAAFAASSVTVTARDTYENIATGYRGTIHFTSSDVLATLPADYTFLAGDNGVKTFSGGVRMRTVGEQSVTATDTVTATITGQQTAITVTPAPPFYLQITGSATTMTAGGTNELTITARDQGGNLATSYSGAKSLTFSGPGVAPGGQQPKVETTVIGNPIVVSFTNGVSDTGTATLLAYKAETTIVNVSEGSLSSSGGYGLALTVYGAAATKMAFTTAAQTIATGQPTAVITVQTWDAYSNPTNVTSSTSLTLSSTSASGTFSLSATTWVSITTVTISSGQNLASFYYKDTLVGTPTITVAKTGWTSVMQQETITPAATSRLVITATSGTMTAGGSKELTITAKDQYGNVATTYTGAKSLTFSGPVVAPSGQQPKVETTVIGNSTSVTFINGVSNTGAATLTAYRAETTTVDVTDGTISSSGGYGLALTVNAAVAAKMAFTTIAQTITVGQPSAVITVQTQDTYGNPANVSATIALTLSSTSVGKSFSLSSTTWVSITSVTIASGQGSASFYYKDTVVGTPTITVAKTGWTSITQQETIIPAAASQLVVSGITDPIVAGTASGVTVTAKDAYGNIATSYMGTIHFTSSDAQATLPGDYIFQAGDNGVKTFSGAVIMKTVGEQWVRATDTVSAITGQQTAITVNPAAVSRLEVTGSATMTAGGSNDLTIRAKDQYGNIVTSYTGTKSLIFSGPGMAPGGQQPKVETTIIGNPMSVSFTNGVSTASAATLIAYKAETTTVNVSDSSSGISSSGGYGLALTVNAATAAKMAFITIAQTVTTGQPSAVMTVQTQDTYGNPANVTSDTTLTLSSTSAGKSFSLSSTTWVSITSVTIASGQNSASFYYKDTLVGTPTITVVKTGWTSIMQPETITPAAASQLVVTGSATMTAGGSNDLTITAKDAYGNVATSYTGTKNLTFSGPGVAPGGQLPTVEGTVIGSATSVNFSNGVSAANAAILIACKAEITTVNVTDGSINSSGYGLALTVNAATAAKMAFATIAQTITAGQPSAVMTVQTQDTYGNPANVSSATTLNLSPTSAGGSFSLSSTTWVSITSVTISSGQNSASFYYKDTVAGIPTITVARSGWTSIMQPETIIPAAAAKMVFTTTVQTITAGQPSAVMTVQTQDTYGNLANVTSDTTLTLSSTSAGKSFSLSSTTWVSITSVTIASGQNSASFYYKDTVAGTPTITVARSGWTSITQPETVTPAAATRLEVTGNATMTAGDTNELTITAKDAYGNLATGYTGVKNLTFSGLGIAPGGQPPRVEGTVVGNATSVSFSNGVSALYVVTLVAYKAEITIVNVTDGSINSSGYGLALTINATAISKLAFITPPHGVVVGEVSLVITVQTQDTYGNPSVVSANATLTLNSTSATGLFSLSATSWSNINSVTIYNGQNSASFYYKDTEPGTPTITVTRSGWTSATQQETVTSIVMIGEVDLQRLSPKGDASWVTDLTVTFLQNGVVVRTENVTTDNQGNFTIANVNTGTYDIRVKGAHTLSKVTRVVIRAGTNSVYFGTLLEGDANNDNAITGADYAYLYTYFGVTSGAGLDYCDFNCDGVVSGLDYALLWLNFNQIGE